MGIFGKGKKERSEAEAHESDAVHKKNRGGIYRLMENRPWIFWGMAVSLLSAFVFSCFYGAFRTNAERYMESPVETSGNVSWLYQSCFLLYRDLRNSQNEEQLDYADIYLDVAEEYRWILDDDLLADYLFYLEAQEDGYMEQAAGERPEEEIYSLGREECVRIQEELSSLEQYFRNLDDSFQILNSYYDYIIKDDITGKYVTNMSMDDINRSLSSQYFLVSFSFDGSGNVTVGDSICGRNESRLRKFANGAIREDGLQSRARQDMMAFCRYGGIRQPENCTVTFCISKEAWEQTEKNGLLGNVSLYASGSGIHVNFYRYYYSGNSVSTMAYIDAGVGGLLMLGFVAVGLLGMFLPVLRATKPWREERACRLCFEVEFALCCVLTAFTNIMMEIVAGVASGRAQSTLKDYTLINASATGILVGGFNLLALSLYFFCGWYIGICARSLRELGLREYIRQRSLIYRFFPYTKGKAVGLYRSMTHLDLTKNAHRSIIKILVINALILFAISFLWFGGLALTLAYTVVLYFILRKYISDLQQKYGMLLRAVDEIAEGNLNVSIDGDLGIFEPFRSQVFKIQDGLKKAVDTEFRSQKMKVELITNMSHDLKTPLTAIITYVNLLKDENITPEQRREYLATLDRKSLRLKSLIEDLFEFSKANSDNVTLNIMDVDIMNLVKQVAFEMNDKIGESGLDIRMNLTEERVILPLDSQKTYRIYENLFGNIAKYALQGTRVYVNGFRIGDTVVITLKNISAQEITVEAKDLTERFVRGDASRNTEGSGLGLAIAKSFTELQGGQLEIEVDGDLFKVTTTWHIKE